MKPARMALAFPVVLGLAMAQNAPPPAAATREMNRRLGLVATRALANFRAADSIEESLKAMGMALDPQVVSLRLRIEAALDETEAAIGKGRLEPAGENLDRAQALLARFAAKIGGW